MDDFPYGGDPTIGRRIVMPFSQGLTYSWMALLHRNAQVSSEDPPKPFPLELQAQIRMEGLI